MHKGQFSDFDLDENGLALLLGEFDHRMRNLFMTIEAAVSQTKSASVEEYRAKLMQPILGLRHLYEKARYGGTLELEALIQHTVHPYCADGARIVASGPKHSLEPNLALALHLVFHELALNSSNLERRGRTQS
jgi:two-component sensor histidine kinase